MVPLRMRVAGKRLGLASCRPGAQFLFSAPGAAGPTVELVVPATLEYVELEKGLETHHSPFTTGRFMLCVRDQLGVDGVVLLDGYVESQERKILILSQSKMRDHSKINNVITGVISTTPKSVSTIADVLSKMRRIATTLKANGAVPQDAFVVLDLFSDWIEDAAPSAAYTAPAAAAAPVTPSKSQQLGVTVNEAVILTTKDEIETVVGGLADRLRRTI